MSKYLPCVLFRPLPLPDKKVNMKKANSRAETKISDVRFAALETYLESDAAQKLLSTALDQRGISLPTLTFVELVEDVAHVVTVKLENKSDLTGLPYLQVISATHDRGTVYEGDIFVSNEALLDFDEEILLQKIAMGEIGEGCRILANASVSEDSILGRNVIVGQNCKIFGSVIGDDSVLGSNVWIGPDVEIESCTLIGADTSLSGKISVGVDAESEDIETQPSFVIIGDNCALDDCFVKRGTIIGGHCLVERNPNFSGIIPDGATVVARGDGFSVVPY
jgi:carbonic anhydrase/acetyltransferase-like protein (isoleucine patch superfamily)